MRPALILFLVAPLAACVDAQDPTGADCVRIEGTMEGTGGTISYVLTDGTETWVTDRIPDNLCDG